MAKMTISDLKTFAAGYVDASKQAGSWSGTKHMKLFSTWV